MSNLPPPVPDFNPNPYQDAEPHRSPPPLPPKKGNTLALVSMILGIVALPLMCVFFIGILPGLIALVLGIIALVQISRNPYQGQKGMAITGVVLGGFCVLSGPIAIPTVLRAREMSNRVECAGNLVRIAKAMTLYSASNTDQYPVVLGSATAQTYTSPSVAGSPSGNASETLTGYYDSRKFAAGDPMACLWVLVLSGNISPKQFICKSDPASPIASDKTDPNGNYYYSFGETAGATVHEAYSYSIPYPWNVGQYMNGNPTPVGFYWRNTVDSSIPIISDMAPLNNSGNPLKNLATLKGGLGAPWVYNSNNHSGGQGQNVEFADTHVEFRTDPYVGQGGDNIWTTGGTRDGVATWPPGSTPAQAAIATQGTIPALPSNQSPYDLIFVPVRNASTNMQ